ncbi:hypothetical protein GO613_06685 [Azoarcus communis]|uniref:3'-5' exoribonuclease n=1 Tax=Parazoarcus communis TaxID=41977 RepID=UPI0014599EC7|nr:3'-5' exoribonuclease [Parazoarcus communis]NMG47781.1 hypothetical protein [Parazoarcus communis]
MLIFLDTEFTDLTDDAALISLGIVTEEMSTFYAETHASNWQTEASNFVRQHVVPQLTGCTEDRMAIAHRLRSWLLALDDKPAQLVIDSEHDWRQIWRLFDEHGGWPSSLAPQPIYFTPWSASSFAVRDAAEFARTTFFAQHGLMDHHALNDARALRASYLAAAKIGYAGAFLDQS